MGGVNACSVASEDLIRRIERLGRAFRAKGMESQARRLRVFWLAARHGLLSGKNELNVQWSEAHLDDWLRTLRLPPFEHEIEVQPRGAGCPSCPRPMGAVPSSRTVLVWPEGARFRCDECGREWLELGV